MSKRPRGTGSLYQVPGSENWYIKYYRNGKAFRESTGTTNKTVAGRILKGKTEAVSSGIQPSDPRITVTQIVESWLADGRANKEKSIEDSASRWRLHLEPRFGHIRAAHLTTEMLNHYRAERQKQPIRFSQQRGKNTGRGVIKYPSDAQINRELSVLRASFRFAVKCRRIANALPYFPIVREHNTRTGFLQDEQYFRLTEECGKYGLWLRALMELSASYGFRKGEVAKKLRVRQVDLRHRTIDLNPGQTKNNDGRTIKMTERVYQIVKASVEGKGPDDLVVTRPNGNPAGDFKKAWKTACERAGVPGLLFHDLRRTAARTMRRLGIGETVAMKIGGWKTRSVFDRYNVSNEADLAEAAMRLEQRQKELETEFGQSSGKVSTTISANTVSAVQ